MRNDPNEMFKIVDDGFWRCIIADFPPDIGLDPMINFFKFQGGRIFQMKRLRFGVGEIKDPIGVNLKKHL